MALDITKPNDSTLFSQLDNYQRETREYVNNLEATLAKNAFIVTDLTYEGGTLEVGTDISDVNLEHIKIQTGGAAQTLSTITKGRKGQIKQFVARDANVTLEQDKSDIDGGSTNSGTLRLNAPDGENLPLGSNDVIVFINIGGDPDADDDGYWHELSRTLAV